MGVLSETVNLVVFDTPRIDHNSRKYQPTEWAKKDKRMRSRVRR